jgi:ABC-type transport system substrate-binding protein
MKYFNYYKYNPAKARALLAAAGYANGFTLKIATSGPWDGSYYNGPMGETIARNFAAVGVKVLLDDGGSADGEVRVANSHEYAGVVTLYGPATTWLLYQLDLRPPYYEGDQHGWHDPVIDRLWLKGQRASPAHAAVIWRQIQDRLVLQAHSVTICTAGSMTFYSKKVAGIHPSRGSWGMNSVMEWRPTGK